MGQLLKSHIRTEGIMPSSSIDLQYSTENAISFSCEALLVGVFAKKKPKDESAEEKKKKAPTYREDDLPAGLNDALQGDLITTLNEEVFSAKHEKTVLIRKKKGDSVEAKRIVIVGLGEAEKWNGRKGSLSWKKAASEALALEGIQSIAVCLPASISEELIRPVIVSAADGVVSATYASLESKDPLPALKTCTFVGREISDAESIIKEAGALARACSFSKDLVNMPSNIKKTDSMVEAARSLLKHEGMDVQVIDDVEWIKTNMPAFYAVSRGALASDPPKFIHLRYLAPGTKPNRKFSIVGKSVIFDTGGYQIKPSEFMMTMKGDMTGGAQVLAAMDAMAELKVPDIEFHAFLAATPNKIDSDALLPDSIIDSACGKKIEIRNTDAEGRLTLIDAVHEALKVNPEFVITVATLTGAAKRCLGENVALMGNHTEQRNLMHKLALSVGDPFLTLDIIEEDYEDIESKLDGADLNNTNHSKTRGSQTAGAFVMSGTPEEVPHLHMDIAGVDLDKEEKATGYGQKGLIQYLLHRASNASA